MIEIPVLDVRLHGRSVGALTRLGGDKIIFSFNDDYIADTARPTLSLSFKAASGEIITDLKPTQTRLPPFFSNLLPEGAMRDYLARQANVKSEREFYLLWVLGQDLPGALKIVPLHGGALPPGISSSDQGAAGHVTFAPAQEKDMMRFSLAGVQLKFSAIQEARGGLTIPANGVGGSWIVKLPSMVFRGVPENEFAMMELARRVGIDVPENHLVPVSQIRGLPQGMAAMGEAALAVKRFDRAESGAAVHMEDFAQVFGVYPEEKYARASYRNLAEVLWIEIGERGIAEFIRRLVFNALIGNGDMHLKNWSLLYPDGRHAQLAPAYDFVSTISYIADDRLALTLVDSKAFGDVSAEQFARFANKAALPEKLSRDVVRDTVARFRKVWPKSTDIDMPSGVRETINGHLAKVPLWRA